MSMASTARYLDSVETVQHNIHAWAKEWGFWDDARPWNFGEKIALIHSELSEALEKHRAGLGKGLPDPPDEHCPEHSGIEVELADVMIRVLDLAEKMGYNMARTILDKMNYNRTRPKKHGKAY